MVVKFKRSKSSSKKNIVNARRKIKHTFKNKNKNKKQHTFLHNPPSSILFKKQTKKIVVDDVIVFPRDIKKLNKMIKEIEIFSKNRNSYNLSINHKNIKEIDNVSILLITCGINEIFNGQKLIKNKKIAPKNKYINERLHAIGYWDALCFNTKEHKNNLDLDYLKIRVDKEDKIENDFHLNIINFFTQRDHLLNQYKDELFDAIFEARANSVEHAFKKDSIDKKTWLVGAHNEKEKEFEFIFYDAGMGIFTSLQHKKSWFAKMINRYKHKFGEGETLRRLCTTNLSKYKKEGNRGYGMIAFLDFIKNVNKDENMVAHLEVATSNFLYLTKDDKIYNIKSPIKGTLIRWVIKNTKGD